MTFYISSLSPVKIFIFSWILWIITFFIKPFIYTYNNFSYENFLTFFLLNLLFLVGMFAGNIRKYKFENKQYNLSEKQVKNIFDFLFIIALFSCFFRLYSIFFVQNYLLYETNYEFKMSIMSETHSAGIYGIISSITLPATLLCLYLNVIYEINKNNSLKGIIVIAASTLLLLDSILKSAFLYVTIYVMFLFFTFTVKEIYFKENKLRIKLYLIIPIIIFLFIYFSYIYQFRIFDLSIVLNSRKIVPNSNIDGHIEFMLINFSHYILHGYYQFVDLYTVIGLKNYYLGAIELYPLIKFFKFFFLESLPSMEELKSILPKAAVYYTFWGDFILDFGKLSFPFSFLLGFLVSKLYINVKKKYFISTIFYPFILIQIFYIPYLNLLPGVFGYFIFFIIGLKIFTKYLYEKKK